MFSSSEVGIGNIEMEEEETKEINIDKIITDISINEGVDISIIISKTRIQKISDIRKAIVLLSNKYCNIYKRNHKKMGRNK